MIDNNYNKNLNAVIEQIKKDQEKFKSIIDSTSAISKCIDISDTIKVATQFTDSIKLLQNMQESLVERINEIIPKINISETLLNLSHYSAIIYLLYDIGWPFFRFVEDSDYDIFKPILDEEDVLTKKENVTKYIFDVCDLDFIKSILKDWLTNNIINEDRKKLFEEAIKCYQLEFYAACVSLLSTQLDGVITDIYDYVLKINIEIDKDFFCDLYKELHPNDESSDNEILKRIKHSEKNQLIALCCSDYEFCVVWEIMIRYMINVIYISGKNDFDDSQPCRNKICHGEQLNFNTKEHALKCILTLDLMINFSNSIINLE